jgi:hypothetical protein
LTFEKESYSIKSQNFREASCHSKDVKGHKTDNLGTAKWTKSEHKTKLIHKQTKEK